MPGRDSFCLVAYILIFLISIKKPEDIAGTILLGYTIHRLNENGTNFYYKLSSKVLWIQPVVNPTTTSTTTISKNIAHAGIPRR